MWMNSRVIINSTYSIANCMFYLCSAIENGGAIFASNGMIDLSISRSFFLDCKCNNATGQGGCIFTSVRNCCMIYCCFRGGYSYYSPSFQDSSSLLVFNSSSITECCRKDLRGQRESFTIKGKEFLSTIINSSNNHMNFQYSTFNMALSILGVFSFYNIVKNVDYGGGASLSFYKSSYQGSYITIVENTVGTDGLLIYGIGGMATLRNLIILQRSANFSKVDWVYLKNSTDYLAIHDSFFDFPLSRFVYSTLYNCINATTEPSTYTASYVQDVVCYPANTQKKTKRFINEVLLYMCTFLSI